MTDNSATTLYLIRHGQTDWAKSGQHTGRTDIPLNDCGKEQAQALRPALASLSFAQVLVSPLVRAQATAEIAGLGAQAKVTDDLAEFDYGSYEGITTADIRKQVPGWTVWTHPCPGGETLAQVQARCQRVIDLACQTPGAVALVAHGHVLRILAATWLGLPATEGRLFMLDTSTLSILGHEREARAIKVWNAPI